MSKNVLTNELIIRSDTVSGITRLSVLDQSDTVAFSIDDQGNTVIETDLTINGTLHYSGLPLSLWQDTGTEVNLISNEKVVIQGDSTGNTDNILELKESGGSEVFKVTDEGHVVIGTGGTSTSTVGLQITNSIAGVYSAFIENTDQTISAVAALNLRGTGTDSVTNGMVRFDAYKTQEWTATAATRNSGLVINTRSDNVMTERVRITPTESEFSHKVIINAETSGATGNVLELLDSGSAQLLDISDDSIISIYNSTDNTIKTTIDGNATSLILEHPGGPETAATLAMTSDSKSAYPTGYSSVGQTFINDGSDSGGIIAHRLYFFNAFTLGGSAGQTLRCEFYEGEGYSGTLLGTVDYVLPSGSGNNKTWNFDSQNIPLTSGGIYTFKLYNVQGSTFGYGRTNTSYSYPVIINGSPSAGVYWDFYVRGWYYDGGKPQETVIKQIAYDDSGEEARHQGNFRIANDTKLYIGSTEEIVFQTNGTIDNTTPMTDVFKIETNGTLSVLSTDYELLVTNDDDIPNKKYVDDAITAASGSSTSYRIENTTTTSYAEFANTGSDTFLSIKTSSVTATDSITDFIDGNSQKVGEISVNGDLYFGYTQVARSTVTFVNKSITLLESLTPYAGSSKIEHYQNRLDVMVGNISNSYGFNIWDSSRTTKYYSFGSSYLDMRSVTALYTTQVGGDTYGGGAAPDITILGYKSNWGTSPGGDIIIDAGEGIGVNNDNGNIVLANSWGNVSIGHNTPTDKLDVNGTIKSQGRRHEITTITANYTTTKNDFVVEVDATSSAIRVELIEPTTDNNGQVYEIDVYDATNTISVIAFSNSTFDVDTITDQGSNIWRFTFNSSPDLSNISISDSVKISNSTNSGNDGIFTVSAVDDTLKYIEVSNASGVAEATNSPSLVQEAVFVDTTFTTGNIKTYRAYSSRNTYKRIN